jgi:hypothetical protein
MSKVGGEALPEPLAKRADGITLAALRRSIGRCVASAGSRSAARCGTGSCGRSAAKAATAALPVRRLSRFELVINTSTATALGPPRLLAIADRVIA